MADTESGIIMTNCEFDNDVLQIIDLPQDSNKPLQLELDLEWLTVLSSTNYLLNLSSTNSYMPAPNRSVLV